MENVLKKIKHSPLLKLICGIIFIIVIYKFYDWIRTESTDNAYVEGDISIVSSEVNGTVATLLVRDNEVVKSGDIIAEINDINYKAEFEKSKANLEVAENAVKITQQKVEIQKLDIEKIEDSLNLSKISFDIADREYDRTSKLVADNFSSKKLLDNAKNSLEKSRFDLLKSQFELSSGQKNLVLLELEHSNSSSNLATANQSKIIAEHALNNTKIRAPIDGVLASNAIKVGNYARQGVPLVAVVPTTGLYVKANFKETQVESFKQGAEAVIKIDGLPKANIKGNVRAIYPATGSKFSLIPPDNATGNFTKVVQRVPVIIDFIIPDEFLGKVKAGMSVEVSIKK